jgi:hypothetical protein
MAKDDYFVIAYKILRTLKAAMKVNEFDAEQISAETLDIEIAYWRQIISILYESGYIKGIAVFPILGQTEPGVKVGNVRITEKGLEYIEENSLMRKAANALKGIKEIIPGM